MNRAAPRMTWREVVLHSLVLVALLVPVFPRTFSSGEIIVPGDGLFNFAPWSHHRPDGWEAPRRDTPLEFYMAFNTYYRVAASAFDEGEWPLWNPTQYMGMPLLANYQSTVFYPPRLLHAFLEYYTATTLFMLLKVWLCGMTAYVCGRQIGLGYSGARFLSIGWMLGGYTLFWSYWPLPDVAAWLPVLFMGVELILSGRYRRGFFSMTFGGTLILLAGHPETAFTMSYGLGMYFFLRLVLERRRGRALWTPIAAAGGAWAVVLLVCMVQLLPFLAYLLQSETFLVRRHDGTEMRYFPSAALICLWLPRFFGATMDGGFWGIADTLPWQEKFNSNFINTAYVGLVVWLSLALLRVKTSANAVTRTRVVALGLTTFLGALLALDIAWLEPIHRLPLLSSMWRNYHLSFAVFALPLAGALAVNKWFSHARPLRDLRIAGLAAGAGALLVGIQYALSRPAMDAAGSRGYVHQELAAAALIAAAFLVVLAANSVWRRPALFGWLLCGLLAADLLYAARNAHPTVPRDHLEIETDLIPYLKGLEQPARICFLSGDVPSGPLQALGIEQLWGYEGIYPERPRTFFKRLSREGGWDAMEPVCAVQYSLFPAGWSEASGDERYELLTTLDGIDVCENRRAMPRAFLVGRVDAVADADAVFERMQQPGYDPGACAVTESPPDSGLPPACTDNPGTAVVQERSSRRMRVEVEASQDCVLVVSETFLPGWKAWISEDSAQVFPVYYTFRGVVVPKGKHTVRFVYDPWSFRAGLAVSVVVLIAGSAAALVLLRRRATT